MVAPPWVPPPPPGALRVAPLPVALRQKKRQAPGQVQVSVEQRQQDLLLPLLLQVLLPLQTPFAPTLAGVCAPGEALRLRQQEWRQQHRQWNQRWR